MGHHISKSESGDTSSSSNIQHLLPNPRNSSTPKPLLDNDGLSRATEITDESMTPPPSPRLGKFQRHRESWRRGAALPTTTSLSRVDVRYSVSELYHHGLSPRGGSDPTHPSGLLHPLQSRTVPVKCPPRKRQTASGDTARGNATGGTASPDDGLEASYLERMYDSRTWEMYRRITEARKRSRAIYGPSKAGVAPDAASVSATNLCQGPRGFDLAAATTPSSDDTSEWEHLQQEEEPPGEETQHEMIFLFDF
jgi:hypothetical protein